MEENSSRTETPKPLPLYRVLDAPLGVQELTLALESICPPGMRVTEIQTGSQAGRIVIGAQHDGTDVTVCIRCPHAPDEQPGHFIALVPDFAEEIEQLLPGRLQRMFNCTSNLMQV